MYLRKKHLSRRTLLRGAGVAMGLPFLDAMVPAGVAMAQTAAAPQTRVGFFYIPHGAIMNNTPYGEEVDAWTPTVEGSRITGLNRIMAPLESYRHLITSFAELENEASAGSVHTINPATWLSCVRPDTGASGASMTTTLDQLIAQRIGQDTALPSLEVCSETTIQVAACGGAGCYYASTTSYSSPNTPLPMEYNPRKVYLQLFGEGDSQAERDAITQQTASLLDLISDRTATLKAELGAADRAALDHYLESVREIERRVQKAGERDLSGIDVPAAPIGELDNFDEQVRLMFDLIAVAYQADLTRVASYVMVAEGTNRTYNHIGVPDSFHPLSHHANDRERIEKLVNVQSWHMGEFARFLAKLDAMPEGDGSVLDHSLFWYGSNMSNSDRHNNYPLPNVLVGGGAGALRNGGRHIQLPEKTPHANLLLTVLNKAGIEMESFADSTGIISDV